MRPLEILTPPENLGQIEPGCYEMPNHDYHSLGRVLSSSGAREILKSPARFNWEREHGKETSKALEDGTLWHAWMLENGRGVVTVEAKNWLTKAAKEKKARILAEGGIPALEAEIDTLEAAKKVLLDTPTVPSLLNPFLGRPELSFFTIHEPTGLLIRTRPDWLLIDGDQITIVDYKTTRDASEAGFTKSCHLFGYHIQAAWYIEALKTYFDTDRVVFKFIAQEKEPPFLAGVYELGYREMREGENLMGEALCEFKRLEQEGYPTTYTPNGAKTLTFKPWMFKTIEGDDK